MKSIIKIFIENIKLRLKDISYFLRVPFLSLLLLIYSPLVKAQSDKYENPAFKNVKTARIIINQDYSEAIGVNLKIRDRIAQLLKSINIIENSESYDLIVSVDITGKPLYRQYRGSTPKIETFYSGAYIKVTITFILNNEIKITKTIENQINPPENLEIGEFYRSPNNAPFGRIYLAPLDKAFFYCTLHSFGILQVIKAIEANVGVTSGAAEVLSDVGDVIAIKPLIHSLQYYNESVIKAILSIKDTCAIEPLINALQDTNLFARITAAQALGPFKDTRATEPLINAFIHDEDPVKNEAAKSLGMIKDFRAVEPLINALNGGPGARYAAAAALGAIKDPRAIEPLIVALNSNNPNMRNTAAFALSVICDPRAIEALIIESKKNEDQVIIIALGKTKDPQAVEPLINALKSSNRWVRQSAASALGTIGDTSAVEPLNIALKDNYSDVRVAAANALVAIKIKDPHAVELLMNDLQSDNWDVKTAALIGLVSITNEDFGYNYQIWKDWWTKQNNPKLKLKKSTKRIIE